MSYDNVAAYTLDELRVALMQFDFEYYVLNCPSVTDTVYDMYTSYYAAKNDGNTWVRKCYDGQKIRPFRHKVKMGSVNRTYELDDIVKFIDRTSKVTNGRYRLSYKYDGIAFSAYYINGYIDKVLTRGNGEEGEDITALILYRKALPARLSKAVCIDVKGEFYVTNTHFETENARCVNSGERPYVGPRQLAGKLIRSYKGNIPLSSVVFRILSDSIDVSKDDELLCLAELGLKPALNIGSSHMGMTKDETIAALETIEHDVDRYDGRNVWNDKPIDGIIIEVANRSSEIKCGGTWYKPGWIIAYKLPSFKEEAFITEVSHDITANGELVPKARFNPPISVGPYVCKELSLYNRNIQEANNYYPGKAVYISITGDVVLTIKPRDALTDIRVIPTSLTTCPFCSDDVIRRDHKLLCIREQECPGAIVERVFHFFSVRGVGLKGIGRETIKEMGLRDVSRLFELNETELAYILQSDKKAATIYSQFSLVKNVSLSKILLGLNIPGIGRAKLAQDPDGSFSIAKKLFRAELESLKNAGFSALIDKDLIHEREETAGC